MLSKDVERTLVLFPGALGDFICFLPALESLAREATVDLFARAEFADLVPVTVKVHSLECYEIRRLFVPGAAEEKRLAEFFASYSAIYSWTGSSQEAFFRTLQCLSRGRARVYPFRSPDGGMHQTDYYLSCLGKRAAGLPIPTILPKSGATEWVDHYWKQHSLENRAVLVMAPGSGATEKNWPVNSYRAIASWWRHRAGGACVVVLGPVEEERQGLNLLLDQNIVARKLRLAQVAALVARGDVYLGNDSGVTHLAAAVGARTVALFGPSSIRQWAPRGKRVMLLSQEVECSPCDIAAMKSCPDRRCLATLTAEKVIRIMENLPEAATLTRRGVEFRLKSEFLAGNI